MRESYLFIIIVFSLVKTGEENIYQVYPVPSKLLCSLPVIISYHAIHCNLILFSVPQKAETRFLDINFELA